MAQEPMDKRPGWTMLDSSKPEPRSNHCENQVRFRETVGGNFGGEGERSELDGLPADKWIECLNFSKGVPSLPAADLTCPRHRVHTAASHLSKELQRPLPLETLPLVGFQPYGCGSKPQSYPQ